MKKYSLLLLITLLFDSDIKGQIEWRTRLINKGSEIIDWNKTNRIRREPYFATAVFENIFYRYIGDTAIQKGWVYNGVLTPRTIDSTFLFKLAEGNKANIIENFFCSPTWGYHWIQVRFMTDRWRGFEWKSSTRNWGGPQVGGFLIGCTSQGLFIAQESELAYIPYSLIRNVRRGQSLGNYMNSRSLQDYGYTDYGSGGGLAGIIAIPLYGIFHALSGLNPLKVHRFHGDSTGMDFQGWVQGAHVWAESRNSLSDFPKAMLQKNRRSFELSTRQAMPADKMDNTEMVADMVWKHEIPLRYAVVQTDINANEVVVRNNVVTEFFDKTPQFSDNISVGIPTLDLEAIETDSVMPLTIDRNNSPLPAIPLFDQRRNMKVQWAYSKFDANQVDPNLIKSFSNIRTSVLGDAQLKALLNKNDIQFLAMYLMTGNGLLFAKATKLTPNQKLILEKVTPIVAEEVTIETVLNAGDMAETDFVNLEKLYQRLNR